MKHIGIIYHSAHGHTEFFAQHVLEGARSRPNVSASLLPAQELTATPEKLIGFDGLIWGSPTYLGGVSGPFKSFMDATGDYGAGRRSRESWRPDLRCRPCPQGTSNQPCCR